MGNFNVTHGNETITSCRYAFFLCFFKKLIHKAIKIVHIDWKLYDVSKYVLYHVEHRVNMSFSLIISIIYHFVCVCECMCVSVNVCECEYVCESVNV